MKLYNFLAPFFLVLIIACSEREKDIFYEHKLTVLKGNEIGRVYRFNVDSLEVNIDYLGEVFTKKGGVIKFLNIVNYSGVMADSKKASSFIYLFDKLNKEIGRYYVGLISSLPNRIQENEVVFVNSYENCHEMTKISFFDSIPSQFFVSCSDGEGDIYTFEKYSDEY